MSVTPPLYVAVLAFDGSSLFHLAVPGKVFGAARNPNGSPAYEVRHCAVNPGLIRTGDGVEIRVDDSLDVLARADIVVVPAWSDPDAQVPEALAQTLRAAHAEGKMIVGLCLGAFVLGDAGLLDGRQATTHWMAREAFVQRFPSAVFRPDVLYVEDGNIVTSAGNVAAIDCCLNLVRTRYGAEEANRMAQILVTPPHRQGGQLQYIERPVPQFPCQSKLPGVLEWALAHLAEPLTLDRLAGVAHMSRRSFTRHFREATGMTVTRWLNAQRVVRAQQLLETTDLPVERIAHEVGFGTALSLRQQFATQLGVTPADYRRSFREGGGAGR